MKWTRSRSPARHHQDPARVPHGARSAPADRGQAVLKPLRVLLLCLLCAAAAGQSPRAAAQSGNEFVPTFSTNSRVKQQIERMERLAGQKLWDEWLTIYQQLVDDPQDLVLARDEEFLVGVRHHCHQLLAAQPPQVRQRYRALQDEAARRLFEKATAENDGAAMRDIYSRYRFTSFGNRALLWIANRALDDGQAELARFAFSILAKDPAVSAGTLLRYAVAAETAGRSDEARAVLERVRKDHAPQPLKLAGRDTTAGAAAAALLESLAKKEPASAGGWQAFDGRNGERRMESPPLPSKLQAVWDFSHPEPPTTGRNIYREYRSPAAAGRFSFLSFPVSAGGNVWVQGPRSISALNLSRGETLWEEHDFIAAPDEVAKVNSNPRTGGAWYRNNRPVQAAPSLSGHLLATRMPLSASGSGSTRWPADFAIVVMDARTGKPLWRKVAGGDPGGFFFNVPKLTGNLLFTGIATYKGGITEYSAVALEAGTGEVLWSTYLGGGSDPLATVDGSPAAVKDGVVWIESTLHTLSGLDLITGDVRVIYRYSPTRTLVSRGGLDTSPFVTNEPISLIAAGNGSLVFAPRWGADVVALDPATGKLLWSSPKAPGGSSQGSLFGVDGKHVYLCGRQVLALNLEDGAPAWSWDPEDTTGELGFAALSGDRIYVPIENQVHVLSSRDGSSQHAIQLAGKSNDPFGYSSLLLLDGKLLVSTRDRVLLFGPE